MSEHINVLLPEEEVDARIQAMGEQISRDYAGKQVHLICVLKGGSFFQRKCSHGIHKRCGKKQFVKRAYMEEAPSPRAW